MFVVLSNYVRFPHFVPNILSWIVGGVDKDWSKKGKVDVIGLEIIIQRFLYSGLE